MGEEKIQPHLQSLRKVLAEFLDWRASEEKQRLDYLERSGAERRRIGAEFERLRRFLAEKEREVLGRLAELDAAFEAAHEDKSERVAEGIARLHGLIGQLEAKRSPQGSGSILSSWSEMRLHLPSGLPAELEKSLSSCRRQRAALREALEESRENSDTGSPEAKPSPGKSPSAEERESYRERLKFGTDFGLLPPVVSCPVGSRFAPSHPRGSPRGCERRGRGSQTPPSIGCPDTMRLPIGCPSQPITMELSDPLSRGQGGLHPRPSSPKSGAGSINGLKK